MRLRVDISSDLSITLRLFGLYPEGGSVYAAKSIFSKTSGAITSKFDDLKWDTQYSLEVNEAKLKAALAQYEKWSADAPVYSLLANDGKNCNAFVADVAKSLGLKTPVGAGSTLPPNFIRALKLANP